MNKVLIIAAAFLFGVALASGALAAEEYPGSEIDPATAPTHELTKGEGGTTTGGDTLHGAVEPGAEIDPATAPERHMQKSGKPTLNVMEESAVEPGAEIDPVTAPKI